MRNFLKPDLFLLITDTHFSNPHTQLPPENFSTKFLELPLILEWFSGPHLCSKGLPGPDLTGSQLLNTEYHSHVLFFFRVFLKQWHLISHRMAIPTPAGGSLSLDHIQDKLFTLNCCQSDSDKMENFPVFWSSLKK